MRIEYDLAPKNKPSDKKAFLIAGYLSESGLRLTDKDINFIKTGRIKYKKGKCYKLCTDCFDWKLLEDYSPHKTKAFNTQDFCKQCANTRKRVQRMAVPKALVDTSFRHVAPTIRVSLSDTNKMLIDKGVNR